MNDNTSVSNDNNNFEPALQGSDDIDPVTGNVGGSLRRR